MTNPEVNGSSQEPPVEETRAYYHYPEASSPGDNAIDEADMFEPFTTDEAVPSFRHSKRERFNQHWNELKARIFGL